MAVDQMATPIEFFTALEKKTFCGFSMGRNQNWAGRVYDLCVHYMTGTPEGSTESGFMEKPIHCLRMAIQYSGATKNI